MSLDSLLHSLKTGVPSVPGVHPAPALAMERNTTGTPARPGVPPEPRAGTPGTPAGVEVFHRKPAPPLEWTPGTPGTPQKHEGEAKPPPDRLAAALVAAVDGLELRADDVAAMLDDTDRKELLALPDPAPVLRALARSILSTRARRAGRIPAGWTSATVCRRCGPVHTWSDPVPLVDGCPWCFNRVGGLPIPRPVDVECRTCVHFTEINRPYGRCTVGAPSPTGRRHVHALDRHRCPRWLPR